MGYTRTDNDPIKTKLISYFEQLEVPSEIEEEKAHLLETLRRPDIVISNFKIRKDKSMQDVLVEVADFLDLSLSYFFRKNVALLQKNTNSFQKP